MTNPGSALDTITGIMPVLGGSPTAAEPRMGRRF